MTIHVSPEAEAKVQQISEFSARLERFINEQFDLEQWRKRRAKPEVAEVVDDGLRTGANLMREGADRAALFARLRSMAGRQMNGE